MRHPARHAFLPFALLALVSTAPVTAQAPTDLYGDPLPPGAVARLGTVRFRHAGSPLIANWRCVVYAVAYSSNRRLLASAAEDHTVRVWDAATGRQLQVHQLAGPGFAVAFTPNNQTIAFAGAKGELGLVKIGVGKKAQHFKGHQGDVRAVAISGDGRLLASAGDDKTVRLWSLATGKEILVFQEHKDAVFWVAFTNDDKTVVSGSKDGTVRFWEVATGKVVNCFEGLPGSVETLALSPDGKKLAVGAAKATLLLWDVATGVSKQLKGAALYGFSERAVALAFSPDGKQLVGAGDFWKSWISVWDVASGKEVRSWKGKFYGVALAFAPDGKMLAMADGDNAVRLFDMATGKECAPAVGHTSHLQSLAVSPDGSKIVSSGFRDTTHLWDAHTGKLLNTWDTQEYQIVSMAFSPDGKTFAGGLDEYTLGLWDVATGKLVKYKGPMIDQCINAIYSLQFTPDGKRVATMGRCLRLFEVATGRCDHFDKISAIWPSLAVAPDGRSLVVTADNLLTLWDVNTKEMRQFGLGMTAEFAAFAGGGNRLLSANRKGDVCLWATGPQIKLLRRFTISPHVTCAASPDGRFLATTGDRQWPDQKTEESRLIRIWEVATGNQVAQFAGHTGQINSLAFTADGRRLVSGSYDTTVLVWDLTGRLKAGKLQPALDARELEKAWADLAAEKVPEAYRAVWALVATPDKGVPILAKQLQPDPNKTDVALRWIKDLADDQGEVRDKAKKELLAMGAAAVPALRKTLAGKPPDQVRIRVQEIHKSLEPIWRADLHRQYRAIFALEQIGSKEARQLLRQVTENAVEGTVIQEATAALARLDRRP